MSPISRVTSRHAFTFLPAACCALLAVGTACSDSGGDAGPSQEPSTTGGSGGISQASGSASNSGGAATAGGSGGAVSTGGAVNGGAGGASAPVDCSGIAAAGFDLCESGADSCGAVFHGSEGCAAVCAAAGLGCSEVWENVEDSCAANEALAELSCESASGHTSDYCVCRGASSGTGGGAGTGGSGSGGEGTGGSGTGGLPTVPDNGCNVKVTDKPTGFASMDGGTVGGGDVTPLLVTTKEELTTYLKGDEPRVLYLMNDLDFRTAPRDVSVCADDKTCDNGSGVQVDNARVSASCDAGEHKATRTRNEVRLDVGSNKTLIGIGKGEGAAIRGAGLQIGSSEQVILRNLHIYDINPNLVEAGDGITLTGSKHIWLDHLLLEKISDGFVDIGSADHTKLDDYVTLSFVHFNGRTDFLCGGHHNFVNFVDNGHVTYHHNWFDNGGGRNPKIGGVNAQVHLFNNYWQNISYFCLTTQTDSEARVESNYFENSLRPHWRQLDGNGTAGIAIDNGNTYTGASSGNTNRDVGGSVFTVPYTYTKQAASEARDSVKSCAGPQPIR